MGLGGSQEDLPWPGSPAWTGQQRVVEGAPGPGHTICAGGVLWLGRRQVCRILPVPPHRDAMGTAHMVWVSLSVYVQEGFLRTEVRNG